MKYVLLRGNKVLTVALSDSPMGPNLPFWDTVVPVEDDAAVSPEDDYDGVTFTRPLVRFVSRDEFLRRFTDDERADMEIASHPVVGDVQGTARKRALVAQFLRWMGGSVDLLHPSMNGVRGALVSLNVFDAQRANELFNQRRV